MIRVPRIIFVSSFFLLLITIRSNGPELMEIFRKCSLLFQNQSLFYDSLARQPLRQKHEFYLYNITNGERFLRFDDSLTIKEIGPFIYNGVDSNQTIGQDGRMRCLSMDDLRFSLNESVVDEYAVVYTLNIKLIRNQSSGSPFPKLSKKDVMIKTTVRDVLREIMDGDSSGTEGVDPIPVLDKENDVRGLSKTSRDEISSNYLLLLRNEVCLRFFRVVQFANPPTHAAARLFQKSPCECLTLTPNGTEGRKYSEYPDVHINNYLFQWNDESCARHPYDPFVPIQPNISVTGNLFWVSSPAYWRNKTSVRYRPAVEVAPETWIKVEPMSDVVTDFFFAYQLNLPIKFVDGISPSDVVYIHPVLLTVSSGVAKEAVESSILRFILYPRERISDLFDFIWFFLVIYLISASVVSTFCVYEYLSQRATDNSA